MAASTLKIQVGPVQGTAMLKLITGSGVSTRLVNQGDVLKLAEGDGIVAQLGICLLHSPDGSIYKMKVPGQVTVTKSRPPSAFALPILIFGEVWFLLTASPDDYIQTPAATTGGEGQPLPPRPIILARRPPASNRGRPLPARQPAAPPSAAGTSLRLPPECALSVWLELTPGLA